MAHLHAADQDELATVEGTPTECADIVPAIWATDRPEDVTCPACLAVLSAKSAGSRARHAISLGESSGLFRDAALRRPGRPPRDG